MTIPVKNPTPVAPTPFQCEIAEVISILRVIDHIILQYKPTNFVIDRFEDYRKIMLQSLASRLDDRGGKDAVGRYASRKTTVASLRVVEDALFKVPGLFETVNKAMNEATGHSSAYDRLEYEITFLLQCAGFIPAPSRTWTEAIVHTTKTASRSLIPSLMGWLSPGVGIAAAVSGVNFSNPPPPEAEGSAVNLVFFRVIQDLYANTVRQLSPGFSQKIAEIDRNIEASILGRHGGGSADWVIMLKRRQTCLIGGGSARTTLKLHMDWKQVNDRALVEKFRRLDTEVLALSEEYSHIPELLHIIDAIRENSLSQTPRRVQLSIHGAPGTGKTRFVNKLARVLGVPLYTLKITSGRDVELLCALPGLHYSSSHVWSHSEASDEAIMTTIPYVLAKHGCNNPILFIEEAASLASGSVNGMSTFSVLDAIKSIFDDTSNSLAAPNLGAQVCFDYSRLTIIMTTTNSLTASATADDALANRFWSVEFPALTTRAKLAALQEALAVKKSLRLNDEQDAVARELAAMFMPYIVQRSDDNGHAGGRVLERVMWHVHARCVSMTAPITGGPLDLYRRDRGVIERIIDLLLPDVRPRAVDPPVTAPLHRL